jgi:hypothetical protein
MRVSSLFIACLVCGLSGTAFLVGAAAESIENRCRMAVRAEMMDRRRTRPFSPF